jgi:hypothetical protein
MVQISGAGHRDECEKNIENFMKTEKRNWNPASDWKIEIKKPNLLTKTAKGSRPFYERKYCLPAGLDPRNPRTGK